MTKFKEFVAQFNGQSVEVVDANNKYQCFDLAVAWVEWLGLQNSFQHLYAYSIYASPTELTKQNFEIIPNTPSGVPQEGDIVVWSKAYNGTAGHVAIATGEGDTNYFYAFSQNDPLGSVCVVKRYGYGYVLGWLRPKIYSTYNAQVQENERKAYCFDLIINFLFARGLVSDNDSRTKDDNSVMGAFNKLFIDNENHRNGYLEFQEKYKLSQEELTKVKEQLTTAQKEIEVLKNEVQQVKDTADINCQKALADQRDSMLIEWGAEKEAFRKSISDMEQIIKDKCVEVIKNVETPLTDRFAGVSMAKRWKAVLEILSAPKKKI